jgi:hypothetical protein
VQWLLVLVVLWGAVLIPPWIADRCRDRPVQTMASFSRRLQQLEQLEHAPYASEALARDAYGDDDYATGIPAEAARFGNAGSASASRSSGASGSSGFAGHGGPDVDDGYGDEYLDDDDVPVRPDSAVSRSALRRRRQIFFLLLLGVVASLGVVLALRTATAVYVHVGALVLFTTYVTLLVRHHQRATERVSKVRYLSPIRAPRPAVVVLRSGTAR